MLGLLLKLSHWSEVIGPDQPIRTDTKQVTTPHDVKECVRHYFVVPQNVELLIA